MAKNKSYHPAPWVNNSCLAVDKLVAEVEAEENQAKIEASKKIEERDAQVQRVVSKVKKAVTLKAEIKQVKDEELNAQVERIYNKVVDAKAEKLFNEIVELKAKKIAEELEAKQTKKVEAETVAPVVKAEKNKLIDKDDIMFEDSDKIEDYIQIDKDLKSLIADEIENQEATTEQQKDKIKKNFEEENNLLKLAKTKGYKYCGFDCDDDGRTFYISKDDKQYIKYFYTDVYKNEIKKFMTAKVEPVVKAEDKPAETVPTETAPKATTTETEPKATTTEGPTVAEKLAALKAKIEAKVEDGKKKVESINADAPTVKKKIEKEEFGEFKDVKNMPSEIPPEKRTGIQPITEEGRKLFENLVNSAESLKKTVSEEKDFLNDVKKMYSAPKLAKSKEAEFAFKAYYDFAAAHEQINDLVEVAQGVYAAVFERIKDFGDKSYSKEEHAKINELTAQINALNNELTTFMEEHGKFTKEMKETHIQRVVKTSLEDVESLAAAIDFAEMLSKGTEKLKALVDSLKNLVHKGIDIAENISVPTAAAQIDATAIANASKEQLQNWIEKYTRSIESRKSAIKDLEDQIAQGVNAENLKKMVEAEKAVNAHLAEEIAKYEARLKEIGASVEAVSYPKVGERWIDKSTKESAKITQVEKGENDNMYVYFDSRDSLGRNLDNEIVMTDFLKQYELAKD